MGVFFVCLLCLFVCFFCSCFLHFFLALDIDIYLFFNAMFSVTRNFYSLFLILAFIYFVTY